MFWPNLVNFSESFTYFFVFLLLIAFLMSVASSVIVMFRIVFIDKFQLLFFVVFRRYCCYSFRMYF